jgi:DNA-binding HxlR family transcriptional regulator
MTNQIGRSSCPVSCALDILGDKWTLLVVRDLIFRRKRYFGDFQNSPEKIASNILSDRLRKLEAAGMVLRQPDPDNGCRIIYAVTEKGLDLILQSWSCYAGVLSMRWRIPGTTSWSVSST